MDSRSLQFIAAAAGGEWEGRSSQVLVSRVMTDSRRVEPGDLFVALRGDKFDGHSFLAEVVRRGARALIVERDHPSVGPGLPSSVGVIAVENTRAALGRLAVRYRQDFDLPIIVVGGSNGKTTTKELIASVLQTRLQTLWSEASFNNDIGVPLTLLRLESKHQAAVIEVGTNHPGELLPLLNMIQPRLGVITSIGREHLEFFHDLAGVVREEGFVAEQLPREGHLFLNGDSEWSDAIRGRTQATVVTVGSGPENTWRASEIRFSGRETHFKVEGARREYLGSYHVRLLGRHQVSNALLALAVGVELGLEAGAIREGLAQCAPPKMRLEIHDVAGVHILDDAYNANADSMAAALQTLRDLPCQGRRVAVLGDMAELGMHAAGAHREIGRLAAELGIDRLVAVGRFARETANAAREAGLSEVTELSDLEAASAVVRGLVEPGDWVLLKASRATGLERLTEALRRAG